MPAELLRSTMVPPNSAERTSPPPRSGGSLPSAPATPRLPVFGVPPRRRTPYRTPVSSTLVPASKLHAVLLPTPANDPHRSTRAPPSVAPGTVGLPSEPSDKRLRANRAWHPPPILYAPKAGAPPSGRATDFAPPGSSYEPAGSRSHLDATSRGDSPFRGRGHGRETSSRQVEADPLKISRSLSAAAHPPACGASAVPALTGSSQPTAEATAEAPSSLPGSQPVDGASAVSPVAGPSPPPPTAASGRVSWEDGDRTRDHHHFSTSILDPGATLPGVVPTVDITGDEIYPPAHPDNSGFVGTFAPPLRQPPPQQHSTSGSHNDLYTGSAAAGSSTGLMSRAQHARPPLPLTARSLQPGVTAAHSEQATHIPHMYSARGGANGTRAPPSSPMASNDPGYNADARFLRIHASSMSVAAADVKARAPVGATVQGAPSSHARGKEGGGEEEAVTTEAYGSARPAGLREHVPLGTPPLHAPPALSQAQPPPKPAVHQCLPGGSPIVHERTMALGAGGGTGGTSALPTWCNGLPASSSTTTDAPRELPVALKHQNTLLGGGLALNARSSAAHSGSRGGARGDASAAEHGQLPEIVHAGTMRNMPIRPRAALAPPQMATRRIGLSYVAKGPMGGAFYWGGKQKKLSALPLPLPPPSPHTAARTPVHLSPRAVLHVQPASERELTSRGWAAKQVALGSSNWSR